ncbi:MAG TPA: D-alanyl-D-alanine carboxypeptidase/D-alanyl-D-alanine-endopeptidase [Phycisphaerae bacterium]|nr:D-alanyl-D-alanine carboxypeptidase/D-alanyl-D-alanine-endopeptidase [Phycisphaerales bacterium]HRX85266.1 D-alanyl-D-alanine carboxypeptidase/D-alanyl-D-alanine-endopeptidase [Phycisphaerae bacterium]
MIRKHLRAKVRRAGLVTCCLLLPALASCTSAARIRDAQLAARLEPILHREDASGARVSARVIDLATGRELYADNIDAPVMPASNMKLITAAVGLDLFGADHEFATYLAYDGENLWLEGTGDPAIGDAKIARQYGRTTTSVLADWAAELKRRGLTSIPGGLRYYPYALDNETIHPSWAHDDLVYWYAAPVSGLNFNDNCVDVTVFPTDDGAPAGYTLVPPVDAVSVVNACTSGSDAPPTLDRLAHADVLVLGGGCTQRRALPSKPVTDPAAFFADALRVHLTSNGVALGGGVQAEAEPLGGIMPPAEDTIVAVHRSAMRDVLWRILKSSQNLFAECLCKLSGAAYLAKQGRTVPGSWAAGEAAARAFLRRQGIDDSAFVGADGSGLSRDNRVTVRIISDVLAAMYHHPDGDAYRAALAEPGGEGTLRGRMRDLRGRVHAKTGYIRGVRALSGYVQTRRGDWLCFSIIFNGIPGSVAPFNAIQDDVCRVLVDWPELLPQERPVATVKKSS